MNEELKEQTIKARVAELLAGECDPWTLRNQQEAWCNMPEANQLVVAAYIASAAALPNNNYTQEGCAQCVVKFMREYWVSVATQIAESEFDSRRRDCEED
jgi:hypothetical protein